MTNVTLNRKVALSIGLSLVMCGSLRAQISNGSADSATGPQSIRTVLLRGWKTPPPRHHRVTVTPVRAVGNANGISDPSNPVSIVSTSAGALGIYRVSGDAVATDSVSFKGGPQIVNTPMQLVFWGAGWATSVNPSMASVTASVKTMLAGPYLSQMTQYGYQSVTLLGTTYVSSPGPNVNYATTDAGELVWNMIDQGMFPEPDEPGGRILYMVVMPPGTNPPPPALGAHSDPWDFDPPADVDYAWVGWVGFGPQDVITKVLSHELVEAISDPEPDSPAWVMNRTLNLGNEIGDACNQTDDYWNGQLLQAYWSQAYRACVLPLGTGRPEVKSLSVRSGPVTGGTTVVITGRLFGNVSAVSFGGMPATGFRVDSMSQITATAPAFDEELYPNGPRVLKVTVTTPFGISITGGAADYSYYPVITGVSPNYGSMDGGAAVTITGAGFQPIRSTAIYFGSLASPNVYCSTSSYCVVATPASGAGSVHVTASVGGVRSRPEHADIFTYAGPTITSMDPAIGPETGGTLVHLTGISFSDTMTVRFGTTIATYLVCQDDRRCSTISPPGKGVVNVSLQLGTARSVATAASQFTYAKFPAISGIVPSKGPATGGSTVTITGSNFNATAGATTFRFGTAAATKVVCSTTQCTMATPPGISIVDVTASVSGLTSVITAADKFSYVPVVRSVTPNTGPESGGTVVTITGAGFGSTQFSSYPSVAFGSNPAAAMACQSVAKCTATSPAGRSVVNVQVTVDGETSAPTSADRFTYLSGTPKGWTEWLLSPDVTTSAGAVAYDEARQNIVYLGSVAGDVAPIPATWTWSKQSQSWVQQAAVSPLRLTATMAYDEAHSVVVLFGGVYVGTTGNPPKRFIRLDNNTWAWDGLTWTAYVPTVRPPARNSASMVYDAMRKKVVLFGGCGAMSCASQLNDTWTWDGVNWHQESPATSPSPRMGAAMSYDPIRGKVILFGGATSTSYYNDTWSWDGVNWTQLPAAPAALVARSGAGMAYSRVDSGLVLFGGRSATAYLNDTWIWNGMSWAEVPVTTGPSVGTLVVGATYDTVMDAMVLLTELGPWTWGGR